MQTILLVEDEQMIQDLYKRVIEQAGYSVYTASDGQTGLNEALSKHPDLILLDISLPQMNGLEVMQKIRQDAWGVNAKIIIMTNQDANDAILAAVSEGKPEYYFLKANVTPEGIILKINEILNNKPQPSAF
jgi:two-component system alkaline phosphatase synthesis response regulator PhoP